MTKFVNLL